MLSKRIAVVDKTRCVACGACQNVCPRNAAVVYRGCYVNIHETLCIGCGKCANLCPVGCIKLKERVKV
ncbi:MAG: 4Fe-4S binding protein [Oscillospiraceae bacterium]